MHNLHHWIVVSLVTAGVTVAQAAPVPPPGLVHERQLLRQNTLMRRLVTRRH